MGSARDEQPDTPSNHEVLRPAVESAPFCRVTVASNMFSPPPRNSDVSALLPIAVDLDDRVVNLDHGASSIPDATALGAARPSPARDPVEFAEKTECKSA